MEKKIASELDRLIKRAMEEQHYSFCVGLYHCVKHLAPAKVNDIFFTVDKYDKLTPVHTKPFMDEFFMIDVKQMHGGKEYYGHFSTLRQSAN